MNSLSRPSRSHFQRAREITAREPGFFGKRVNRPPPDHLWIGRTDSRVPGSGSGRTSVAPRPAPQRS
jgi:hypothetical protein